LYPYSKDLRREAIAYTDKQKVNALRILNKNPYWTAFRYKRRNARRLGIEFSLIFDNFKFPKYCPVLGYELNYSYGNKKGHSHDDSPSFDRFNSSKGYVDGNVQIISQKANRIKNNASIEQLEKILEYMKSVEPSPNING